MSIYIFNWVIISILGFLLVYIKKYRKVFLYISFFIMALTLGLRGMSVGEDTSMYLSVAKASNTISWQDILCEFPKSTWSVDVYGYHNKVETGYLLLNKIIMSITGNPQWVLIIVAFITCYGIGKFIYNNSVDVFFSTIVFLCGSLFMFSFNGMRQVMAMSIAINSYTDIKNKRYKKALLLILISSLFHQSTLVYLILFLLVKVKNQKRAIKLILIGSFLSIFMIPILTQIISRFNPYYASYLTNSFWQSSVNGIILLWFIEIAIVLFLYFSNYQNIDEFISSVCLIIYLAIQIISLKYTGFSRMGVYFEGFLLLLFPIFSRVFRGNNKLFYFTFIWMILSILYFKSASTDARLYSIFLFNY